MPVDVHVTEGARRELGGRLAGLGQMLERKKVEVIGREGLEVIAEGKDPMKKEKARSKVVFGKRGDRVVAFYITQWRPIDGNYDSAPFEVFDKFVKSFKFLKKSFYETL